jgi:type II secretory pathway pseudopilin PulG
MNTNPRPRLPGTGPVLTSRRAGAFTMAELLVVITIIILLMSILVPVVSKVRQSARNADVQNQIAELGSAIDRYYNDFQAYPGPLSNDQIRNNATQGTTAAGISFISPVPASDSDFDTTTTAAFNRVTMAENLVLGLAGGLRLDPGGTGKVMYDPGLVGKGPASLNQLSPRNYPPYLDVQSAGNGSSGGQPLSWRRNAAASGHWTGQFKDEAATAQDSAIPEILDRFPDGLPILYLRARTGLPAFSGTAAKAYNGVISSKNNQNIQTTNSLSGSLDPYDLSQIYGYTRQQTGGNFIGVSKRPPRSDYPQGTTPNPPYAQGLATADPSHLLNPGQTPPPGVSSPSYVFPLDAYPYLADPQFPNTARRKDSYILISAGPDRIYGTFDDITNFGSVRP